MRVCCKFGVTKNQFTMTNLIEVWKDIKDYEGLYQISNLGRVKSLARTRKSAWGVTVAVNECIRKQGKNHKGYNLVGLLKHAIHNTKVVHLLVWDHFGIGQRDGMIITVDHIDNDKNNNRIDNLQLLPNRDNNSKNRPGIYPTGVFVNVGSKRFYAGITVNKKYIYLGSFTTVNDASNAYQMAKNNL